MDQTADTIRLPPKPGLIYSLDEDTETIPNCVAILRFLRHRQQKQGCCTPPKISTPEQFEEEAGEMEAAQ